ncbi:unnamed protein product, partial [Dicrocoelium dendriticum]
MSNEEDPFISVEPEEVLYMEVSRNSSSLTRIAVDYVILKNLRKSKVYYKVESNRPNMYHLHPDHGCIDADEEEELVVFLPPFDCDEPDDSEHWLTIYSIQAQSEEEPEFHGMWECADPKKIRAHKLRCVPWIVGELVVEPNPELVFKGPFDVTGSASLRLTNPSEHMIHFHINTPSNILSVVPNDDTISPKETKTVTVVRKTLGLHVTDTLRDRLSIKASILPSGTSKPTQAVLDIDKKTDLLIKCVFKASEPPTLTTNKQPSETDSLANETVNN